MAHAAGLFMKHGFDVDGLMPYEVFCNVLFQKPNRLLGARHSLLGRHTSIVLTLKRS